MKVLIVCLALLGSASAYADAFSNFIGSYSPSSTPQVSMSVPGYCDWQGFREIIGVTITNQNGVNVADLASKINNSPVHSFTTFQEYSYSEDYFDVKNTAKISGDVNGASYQMVNSTSNSMESFVWSISKSEANYHLRLTQQSSNGSPTVISCIYDVDLQKQ
jgi:hypothetical protein